ncbi:MAG: ribosome maturation factor RimM [Pseudomonadota bacterium]|nr:ribosome maturation factor RimM [Pseudomonadota bacterium]
MTAAERKRILLGRITGAHGIKGELRIATYTGEPEALGSYGPLEDAAGARRFEFASLRAGPKGAIARLKGVDDRSGAEALAGTELYVERARLPEPEAGDFYIADLIGLVAVSAEGSALGQVVSVQNFGAGNLLEIRPSLGGETVLVPFTNDIVPEVDLEAGWLLLAPPEGLFE